ncbi:DUF4203 domain-containing protein [Propionicicella superfundia]|uniref:TM7S3/TM198-like domain-containing protein n=1 Tax=Propionicicella superfundia TaxID=348582 RepID=UPI0003F9B6BC|nr:DUF4203 domain-containing protein [Propionicicella superfundia]
MNEITLGAIAVLVGALLAFRGYPTMRLIISLLGGFVGFVAGAAVGQSLTSGDLLSGPAGWVAGVVGAILLGALSYTFYRVAIVLGMGAMGFTLATSAMALLGVTQSWAVFAAGAGAGLLLVVLALATDLPAVLIVVLTALTGADIVVRGVRLVAGDLTTGQILTGTGELTTGSPLLWWGVGAAVAVLGVAAQSRYVARGRRRSARSQWSHSEPARA